MSGPIQHTLSDGLPTGRGPFTGSQFPAGTVVARSAAGGVGGGNGGGPAPPDGFTPADLSADAVWYLFDEGSGQVAADSSVNAAHAQLGSTSGADADDPDWVAEGLDFDAVADDLVEPPYTQFFNNNATVFLVVNRSAQGTLIHQSAQPANYTFLRVEGNKLQLGLEAAAGHSYQSTTDDVPIGWTSLAGVYEFADPGEGLLSLQGYIDGGTQSMVVDTAAGTPRSPGENQLSIGGDFFALASWGDKIALVCLIPDYLASAGDIAALHTWAAAIVAERGISI